MSTAIPYNGAWRLPAVQKVQSQIYSFKTGKTYIDRDIEINVKIPGIEIPTPETGESEFYITIGGVTYTWHVNSAGDVWVD